MFQKFKGLVDSIAEEQAAFHRTPQPSQRSSQSTRRPPPRTSSPSAKPSSRNSQVERNVVPPGPDPDPKTFDPEFVIGGDDETPSRVGTPGPDQGEAGETRTRGAESAEQATTERGKETVEVAKEDASDTITDLPVDVKSKLRRLQKLESKYQELLKAYRKAHARNAAIEPFEARLRESTPLTSINDPGALVDYLNQLNVKGDMAMDELKKASQERDSIKIKLEEAEQENKKAWNEVARLKETKEATPRNSNVTEGASTAVVEETDERRKSRESPRQSSERSPKISSISSPKSLTALLSPKRTAVASANVEDQSEEVFSIDNEVPRLEAELEDRNTKITALEAEKKDLQDELSVAKESTEQMMRDLETAQTNLENLRSSHEHERNEMRQRTKELEQSSAGLSNILQEAEAQVQAKESELSEQKAKILELERRVNTADEMAGKVTSDQAQDATHPSVTTSAIITPSEQHQAADDGTNQAKKKKSNKKKKKKGNATQVDEAEVEHLEANGDAKEGVSSQPDVNDQLKNCLEELDKKNATIEQLQNKLRLQEDKIEEIEQLKDELVNVGQEHVEAKDSVKSLQEGKQKLEAEIARLEEEVSSLKSSGTATADSRNIVIDAATEPSLGDRAQMEEKINSLEGQIAEHLETTKSSEATAEADKAKLSKEFNDLKLKIQSLQTDLTAAQQLAATRYKEITSLKELIQKAQPELASLRSEVSELKSSKDELNAKAADLRRIEAREENLRVEVEAFKRKVASKDVEITKLNQRYSEENSKRLDMEESNRKAQRDAQRNFTEKTDAISARDNAIKSREQAEQELSRTRTRLQHLENQVSELTRDADGLREEISLKTAQHASAQSLMTSVRDQAGEMGTQLKESKERCESLEEELADAHRLMNERGREGETMRRLLSEVEGRANSRVKEMRERMEVAIQERDRAEEESNNSGRRRARELDELRNKLRKLERDLKVATEDKADLERTEKDLLRQKEDDARRVEESTREVGDVKKAMAELRDALDDGERQARDLEVERGDLKKTVEDLQQRLDKVQKSNKTLSDELKTLRTTRIRPSDTATQSSRPSTPDSSLQGRGASSNSREPAKASGAGGQGVDYVYLKNVLLQFLEQKDKAHQRQLVPVLGMLLHFDREEGQKWMTAINAR